MVQLDVDLETEEGDSDFGLYAGGGDSAAGEGVGGGLMVRVKLVVIPRPGLLNSLARRRRAAGPNTRSHFTRSRTHTPHPPPLPGHSFPVQPNLSGCLWCTRVPVHTRCLILPSLKLRALR